MLLGAKGELRESGYIVGIDSNLSLLDNALAQQVCLPQGTLQRRNDQDRLDFGGNLKILTNHHVVRTHGPWNSNYRVCINLLSPEIDAGWTPGLHLFVC